MRCFSLDNPTPPPAGQNKGKHERKETTRLSRLRNRRQTQRNLARLCSACNAHSIWNDYDMCYLAIALCGRRHNSGTRLSDWIRAYQKVGLCKISDMINRKYESIPTDNVIIMLRGHIFAIRNGKHSDGAYASGNANQRVRMAWRIPQSKG